MARNKCPGLDGLSIEFYDTFFNEISGTLHSLYMNTCDQTKKLNPTAREGVISLLEKEGKNPLKLKGGWRPLTMLSCDFKIFAKIIANRLQMVLPTIIHNDQKGFIKGRKNK